jgi:hypothetical protein
MTMSLKYTLFVDISGLINAIRDLRPASRNVINIGDIERVVERPDSTM